MQHNMKGGINIHMIHENDCKLIDQPLHSCMMMIRVGKTQQRCGAGPDRHSTSRLSANLSRRRCITRDLSVVGESIDPRRRLRPSDRKVMCTYS